MFGVVAGKVPTARSPSFAPNQYRPTSIKELSAPSPAPAIDCRTDENGGLTIALTGTSYHLLVHLESARAGTTFSDNDFDLMKGEVRTLGARSSGAKLLSGDITLRSLATGRW